MYFATTKELREATSIVASEEVSGFEIESVMNPLGSKKWRSTSTSPNVVVNFSKSVTVRFWGAFYTNAVSTDTLRLRLANTEAALTSSPLLDVTERVWPSYPTPGTADLSSFGYIHQRSVISSPVSSTWARLDADFSSNTDGFVEFGSLFLSDRIRPSIQHRFELDLFQDARGVKSVDLLSGGVVRSSGGNKRDARITFSPIGEADALGNLMPTLRNLSGVNPVAAILLEDESDYPMDYIYYGYLEPSSLRVGSITNEIDFRIREP